MLVSQRLILPLALFSIAIFQIHAAVEPSDTINFDEISKYKKDRIIEIFKDYVFTTNDSIAWLNVEADSLAAARNALEDRLQLIEKLTDESTAVFNNFVEIDNTLPYILRQRQEIINLIISAKTQLSDLQHLLITLTDDAERFRKHTDNFDMQGYIEENTYDSMEKLQNLFGEISNKYEFYLSPQQQAYFDDIFTSYGNLINKFY